MAKRMLSVGLILAIVLLAAPPTIRAAPPPPETIWGTVKINGQNVADGTVVVASCADAPDSPTTTYTDQGESLYIVSVDGDDLATAAKEGCSPGETITFTVDGLTADQTTPWQSGYIRLDLTAFRPLPALTVEKHTNTHDADAPPGPSIRAGDPITWTYTVTNTGNVPLTQVAVTDDRIASLACTTDTLAVDQAFTCTETDLATGGAYANLATAEGFYQTTRVTDTDPSHYFGVDPSIVLDKRTNGDDAPTPPGAFVPVDSTVTWTYAVTNTGNVTLTIISLVDDPPVDISCPSGNLAPDQGKVCEATGTALRDQQSNTATVTAGPGLGDPVTASDTSYYFGADPAVTLEKLTNGVDADEPPGPYARVGETVTWSYVVTNTGNITLTTFTVTDDQSVTVTCDDGPLPAGISITCTGSALAEETSYANVGLVSATPLAGASPTVTDTDRSHYFGIRPELDLEKHSNGVDADTAPGPPLRVGDTVTWTYTVTNTGNITITGVTITDTRVTLADCPIRDLAPNEVMACEATGVAVRDQYSNLAGVSGLDPLGSPVTDTDLSHYFGLDPAIALQKRTNGIDADGTPTLYLRVGDPVTWTYTITNTGNVALTSIALSDDEVPTLTCSPASLGIAASRICMATGTVAPGNYVNTAVVTGTAEVGSAVTAMDTNTYFGVDPGIALVKRTNGEDADTAPGPLIRIGKPVTWTFTIANTGNSLLTAIELLDDQLDEVTTCPTDTLNVGEQMTCTVLGVATADQHANVGTVWATPLAGDPISATDASHYFGVDPALVMRKLTNGEEADAEPGPFILVGDPVAWTYLITNTGNITVTDLTVTDDQLPGPVSCLDTELPKGASTTCTATGIAQRDQYENWGTATATPPVGDDVTATDVSHYFGADPDIALTKRTNGVVATAPPGPFILVNDPVTWTYTITNTGNITLTQLQITDRPAVTITCPTATLAVGDQMVCSATGTAIEGQFDNEATATAQPFLGGDPVGDSAASHYFGSRPALAIEKRTNGEDADDPPGPDLWEGEAVVWTYTVTNTGNVTLTAVSVVDDQIGLIGCVGSQLAENESMTCSAEDLAQPGSYANIGTASGKPPGELDVIYQSDPSHYRGTTLYPSLELDKRTNGGNGVYLYAGDPVTWTYTVENTGNTVLTDTTIIDNNGTPSNLADDIEVCTLPTLELTATQVCTLSGIVQIGDYANRATATATAPAPTTEPVTDTDTSSYFGMTPGLLLVKDVNGHDADTPPGPYVLVGDPIIWTFAVTNTSNITVTGLSLEDDQVAEILCLDTTLGPDQGTTCTATGTAAAGQQANTAVATVILPNGAPITATDSSHYFGVELGLLVEKRTAGFSVESPPGVDLLAGYPVTWTYTLTNTGNVTVTGISAVDDVEGTLSCPETLGPEESTLCEAQGEVQPDQYANTVVISGTPDFGDLLTGTDTSAYFGLAPSLVAELWISGDDGISWEAAPAPPGAEFLGDGPLWLQVVLTNTGNIPLTDIGVTSPQAEDLGPCATVAALAVDVGHTCSVTIPWQAGPQQMIIVAAATAVDALGRQTTPAATAAVHYIGAAPALAVEKSVGTTESGPWDPADTSPGPELTGDTPPWFRVAVTNTGNITLTAPTLVDDAHDLTACLPSDPLTPGGAHSCTIAGVWAPGQHTSAVTATAPFTDATGTIAIPTAEDLVHYFGSTPGLDVTKWVSTDGDAWYDANTEATALEVEPGADIRWRIAITNTGNIAVTLDVTDTLDGTELDLTPLCVPPPPWDLLPGAARMCQFGTPDPVGPGTHQNELTVAGVTEAGTPVAGVDVAFYILKRFGIYLPLVIR